MHLIFPLRETFVIIITRFPGVGVYYKFLQMKLKPQFLRNPGPDYKNL